VITTVFLDFLLQPLAIKRTASRQIIPASRMSHGRRLRAYFFLHLFWHRQHHNQTAHKTNRGRSKELLDIQPTSWPAVTHTHTYRHTHSPLSDKDIRNTRLVRCKDIQVEARAEIDTFIWWKYECVVEHWGWYCKIKCPPSHAMHMKSVRTQKVLQYLFSIKQRLI